jgi:hypothetical protein
MQESGLNPFPKRGAAGEIGPFQLMPDTARRLGIGDPFNPEQNAAGGIKLLHQLFAKFGNWQKAIAAYNEGPRNVSRYGISASELARYVSPVEASAAGIDIDKINIYIQGGTNMSHADLARSVKDGIDQAREKASLRLQVQTSGSQ